jgi:glycosyltransferase involved in cell wall biosynthesis
VGEAAMKKRILLISAYDADSHRYWREGLAANLSGYDWTQIALPARYFSWRIRGNPLSLFAHENAALSRHYDLLIATSMTDIATLKGLFPGLAQTPTLVYFHENQFAYPDTAQQKQQLEACMVNLYSALAADRIVFNSDWNRRSFLSGLATLIQKLPDLKPEHLPETLQARSHILPVPLENKLFQPESHKKPDIFTLTWNHRWEYDKAPERLYQALLLLKQEGVNFRLNLIGQQFRHRPAVFDDFLSGFRDELQMIGYIESRDDYIATLRNSHVAISTALHDFQGLALLEAVACGCIPVAPDRLAYPEFFAREYLYTSSLNDPGREAQALAQRLMQLSRHFTTESNASQTPDIQQVSWQSCRQAYTACIEALTNG